MSRILRIVCVLLAAAVVASCSSAAMTRLAYANAALAYSNLGSAIVWTVDDYVDMNDAQEAWVKERAARLVDWHRSEELPRARRVLQDLLESADGPFKADQLAALQLELRAHYQRAMGRLAADMAEFLATVDAQQLARIEKKMAEDNRQFLKESVRGTPEDRRKRRLGRVLNHLEAWTGPLGEEQRGVIGKAYRDIPDPTDDMLAERRHRQAEVLALVRARAPKAEMEAQLRRLFVNMDDWRRPEYREQLRARDARLQEALATVSTTFTSKQRGALKARIEGLIRDIDKVTAAS
jgi:hypothetical protein